MKKKVGSIEVEVDEVESCGDAFIVSLSVRTSTIKKLLLTAADARDLHYAIGWALNHKPHTDRGEQ